MDCLLSLGPERLDPLVHSVVPFPKYDLLIADFIPDGISVLFIFCEREVTERMLLLEIRNTRNVRVCAMPSLSVHVSDVTHTTACDSTHDPLLPLNNRCTIVLNACIRMSG
jgi:hypothetical protein